MRIVFMGTPDFAVPVLRALNESRHEVVAVYTKRDEPKGRSGKPAPSPVKEYALSAGLTVVTPPSFRKPERVEKLASFHPDVIVVAAYGLILRKDVLEIPKYGCINVHASLLPKYRGAAPIQWAILNGETETGITIMQMNEGLDTGDILKQKVIPIDPEETAGSLFDKLSNLGEGPLLEVLDEAEAGTLTPEPQGESPTEYAKMLTKEMGDLDFTESAEALERKVRAFSPWPSAYSLLSGKRIKILEAEVSEECVEALPGTVTGVTKDAFTVATGKGGLKVTRLQPEGKKAMTAAEYLRGNALSAGVRFGA